MTERGLSPSSTTLASTVATDKTSRDTTSYSHAEEDQIPFLVDHQHGITMCESDEIVDYLDERYG